MVDKIKHQKLQAKVNWSLNISQKDDTLYTLPARSSNSALKLAKDQWCKAPIHYLQSRQQNLEQGRCVEATLFLSSAANYSLELVCHDPLQDRTSSYQVEANSEVITMQISPLPAGVRQKQKHQKASTIYDQDMEAFGILLLLATVEGVSAFSMVFTKTVNEYSFALEECIELSRNELQDINTPLIGRRVRHIQSKIVAGPISDEEILKESEKKETQQTQTYLILAVSSSPETKSGFSQESSYLHNVDAFLFSLVDHYCPVFRYRRITRTDSLGMPSLAHFQSLLKGVGRVKSLEFGGDNLLEKGLHTFLAILLIGELKLVSLPTIANFQASLNSHRIKVQTVLLSGVCAHPSMSDLGEAIRLEPNKGTNTIAVLCRPKIDEIGFKSSTPSGITLSSRRSVSFSPVDVLNDFTPGNNSRPHFLLGQDGDRETPKNSRKVVSPESDCAGESSTPKKSNLSHMSTASSLVGLRLVGEETVAEDSVATKLADAPVNLSIETTESSLVGLDLVSSRSVSGANDNSLVSPINAETSEDILDLTGKWHTPDTDIKLSGLSPLSGLKLNSSAEGTHFQTESLVQSATTPRQAPHKGHAGRFAPGSALKTIRCTTPAIKKKKEGFSESAEHLSHVVVLKVEQTRSQSGVDDDKEMRLKVSHLSVALPPNLSSFRTASMAWVPLEPGGIPKILSVASNDRSDLNAAFLAVEGSKSLEVIGTASYDTTPLFNNLERTAQNQKYVYGIRSIALVDSHGEKRVVEGNRNTMEIRLIVSTSIRDAQHKDNRGNVVPMTPISMSLTEDSHVSVVSATLPMLQSLIPGTEIRPPAMTVGKRSVVDETSLIAEKFDEVMSFLQGFEECVKTRMDAMDERIAHIEEAMRTV